MPVFFNDEPITESEKAFNAWLAAARVAIAEWRLKESHISVFEKSITVSWLWLYHCFWGVCATLLLLTLTLIPHQSLLVLNFFAFTVIALLLETLELDFLRFPTIRIADALYIVAALSFPIHLVLGIVALGTIGKVIYEPEFSISRAALLFSRLLVFGCSTWFFEVTGLQHGFHGTGQAVITQIGIYFAWLIGYSFLSQLSCNPDVPFFRRSTFSEPAWYIMVQVFFLNLLVLTPLAFLLYGLYEILHLPLSWVWVLMIPLLVLAHRKAGDHAKSSNGVTFYLEATANALNKTHEFMSHDPIAFSNLAGHIALAMWLTDKDVTIMERAGFLHNVGITERDHRTYYNLESLTLEELETMQKYPETVAGILSKYPKLEKETRILQSHHEYFDGSGHPEGLRSTATPLGSRILSVVDAFIFMVTDRPRGLAMTFGEAVKVIRKGAGTKYDPNAVHALQVVLRVIERKAEYDPQQKPTTTPLHYPTARMAVIMNHVLLV